MGSKTKIIVLHMKEIIYTVIFAALGILLIILLFIMFGTGTRDETQSTETEKLYTPGIYTSTLTLSNTALEVEVTVDEYRINSVRFSNLEESVATTLPLVQPVIEDIAEQIYDTQSLDNIELSDEAPYTSQLILEAISEAVEKAAVNQTAAFPAVHLFSILLRSDTAR